MDSATFHTGLRTIHIAAAFSGLVVFWLPLLVRKGGRLHVVCGWLFVVCATVALLTALVVSSGRFIDPIDSFPQQSRPSAEQEAEFVLFVRLIFAFLAALAFFTLVPMFLAVRVVRTRQHPDRLAGGGTRLLLICQLAVSVGLSSYGSVQWFWHPNAALCAVLVVAGISGAGATWWDLRFLARPNPGGMFWWYKHMEFMLRTGIAFHTAFAVFVLSPWLGRLGSGYWALLPWIAPSALGLPAVWLWVRHYRRRFGDLPLSTSTGQVQPWTKG